MPFMINTSSDNVIYDYFISQQASKHDAKDKHFVTMLSLIREVAYLKIYI